MQVADKGSTVNGSDPQSFRNALKHAGRNGKPEQPASKDAPKPEKAQAKPGAPKPQKTGSATQQKNGRKPTGDPGGPSRPVRPAAGRQAADDSASEADTQDGPGASDSHAEASHSQTSQNAQPTAATTSATPPPTPAPPPAGAAAPPTRAAATSQNTEADSKAGSAGARATVRAVKPGLADTDDAESEAVSKTGQSDGDATSATQDASLAAGTDPGSVVAMAAIAKSAAVSGAGGGMPALGDSSVGDDDAASVAAVSASATSGMDFLSDLASVAVDPPDDADKTEPATAKPAGNTPAGNSPFSEALNAAGAKTSSANRAAATAPTEPKPEARFAEVNHPSIVTGVRGELLPSGGTMQLRLDPPELGDLQISVHMRDGVMTADFQTSSDQATRLLSHSLGNLKSMLEAQGVNVDKLHVQQGPKSNTGDSKDSRDSSGRQPTPEQRQSDRRDQQRKEIVQKMWDKLAGKAPVDVMA